MTTIMIFKDFSFHFFIMFISFHKFKMCYINICQNSYIRIIKICIFKLLTRSFHHNNVIFFGKGIVGFHNIRNQCFLIFKIISGTHGPQNFPVYDHLGTNIIGRLQKDGVHKNRRFDPGCFRLHDLSPSHLQTILCDK